MWEKKTVTLEWEGMQLPFHVAQELFSSHEIDQGTRLLLRSLDVSALPERPVVLDFGCGYGPLGLAIKARLPAARVVLIDRDALAVAFTEWNGRELGLSSGTDDLVAHGGLDFVSVLAPEGYDLILWNVPGKAGAEVLRGLIDDAPHALQPNGLLALVVVNPLAATMREAVDALPFLTVTLDQRYTAHTVMHLRREESGLRDWPRPLAFDRGVFDRPTIDLDWRGHPYTVRPTLGLPEYDGPDFATGLMMDSLVQLTDSVGTVRRFLGHGMGQGHAAILAATLLTTDRTSLVERDLLALETTRRNLTANGVSRDLVRHEHAPLLDARRAGSTDADLILYRLGDQLSPARLGVEHARLLDALASGGTLVVSGPSTSVSRFLGVAGTVGALKQWTRKRRSGASVSILAPR
ncbi:MAG: methyltransferase [Chloroflexia bacterium]|nr:methyltransferase [Chloroflexia bacterium]